MSTKPEPTAEPPPLVLASGSRYRKMLLEGFTKAFSFASPDIDETPRDGEAPDALAQRLATEKALKVSAAHKYCTVIGSDQVASLNGKVLGKPGNYQKAVEQLEASNGNTVIFYTAICLVSHRPADIQRHLDVTRVHFKALTRSEIENYVKADQPYDCAGSFRSEGLGASLIESIENADPTALIGLPMVWLTARLRELGYRGNG